MIVRINQLEIESAEQQSGWGDAPRVGPIRAAWPADAKTFELVILEQDEQGRALPEAFRQSQLRQIIPQALIALREPGEETVVRLDGPLAEGELLSAFYRLTGPEGADRFAMSPAAKRAGDSDEVIGSVRMQGPEPYLANLCADPALGLERRVRLRAVCASAELSESLVQMDEIDDPRWSLILPAAGYIVSTTRGLRSLLITTPRLDAAAVKLRIMQQIFSAAARAAEQSPATRG
jgi:hypothetical protein